MSNTSVRELCEALIKADSEDDVIEILAEANYWDDPSLWRYYGDRESNFNTIGNQQSQPEAALVEKLVNSLDARLMNECLVRNIDPEGPEAPQTIRHAVATFFEDNPNTSTAGLIREWLSNKRTEVARGITIAATGAKPPGNPCLTVCDCGEGQSPQDMPTTLLSLDRSNKLRIPFVQGKFNMGGTGALKFCGNHSLQLIVSRRNPALLDPHTSRPTDTDWSFAVVRRELPEGGRRSSVYTYLAPIGAEKTPHRGELLHFRAGSLTMLPDGNQPYARDAEWGTLIKLYEYTLASSKSHVLRKRCLLSRLDVLMPEVALPIRVHECRDYRGHEGSFETTLTGLSVRLEDDKADNIELSSSSPMSVDGEQMTATIYAFRKGKADTYRRNEGVIFTVNGQTHGHLSKDFFRSKRVGLSYLRDSILVVVDGSKLSGKAREDLFMNSRDRLSEGNLRKHIVEVLQDMLKRHPGLRALKERRRREETQDKLADSKPLEEILRTMLAQSPTLAKLFLTGERVSVPFKTQGVVGKEQTYEGKRYPTYFKFKGQEYGTALHRDCDIDKRCRIAFETDVVDDYFSRDIDTGQFTLVLLSGGQSLAVQNYSLNLHSGIATLNLQLPPSCRRGDQLTLLATVTDPAQATPFRNRMVLAVLEPRASSTGGTGRRRHPPGSRPGRNREKAAGIELPNIIKVGQHASNLKKQWQEMSPPFNQYSALRVLQAGTANDDDNDRNSVYDFYINVDNLYLKTEQKAGKASPQLIEARFVYGMVLLGLGLLREDAFDDERVAQSADDQKGDCRIAAEDQVEQLTTAVAPMLLPMINHLGGLELEDEVE